MERPSSLLENFLKDNNSISSPTSNNNNNNNIYNNLPVRGPKMGISVKLNSQFDLEQSLRSNLPTSPSSVSQQMLQHQHQQPIYSNQSAISSPRSHNFPPHTPDDSFDRNHSFSSRRSNASDTSMEYQRKLHQFVVRTFTTPVKCHHCTSVMVIMIIIVIV